MKRRDFLKISAPMAAAPLFLNSLPVRAFATQKMVTTLDCNNPNDRVLVVIFMAGANDGVNTIIPVEQYDFYANIRPSLRIPNSGTRALIPLDSSLKGADAIGLHPAMQDMKAMYEEGKVNIVQGVGYPSINRSHFRSRDLWSKGSDGIVEHAEGWIGRYLETRYPNALSGPTPEQPDPLGIQLGGSNLSLGFHTTEQHAVALTLSGQDPGGFYTYVSEVGGILPDTFPNSDYGNQLAYLVGQQNNTGEFAERITNVFNEGTNRVNYPDNSFSNQLKTVARLINGGSKTKIYYVKIDGFDTHSEQVSKNDTTIGRHTNLLNQLTKGIKTFYDDLKALYIDHRVVSVAYSEFGRKVKENGSLGTDHGTIAPMFVFGPYVRAGVTGTNVNLSDLDGGGALKNQGMQHDYRSVFGSLLVDWLGATNTELKATNFESFIQDDLKLSLIDTNLDGNFPCEGVSGFGEVGKVTLNQPYNSKWQNVYFMHTYADPVVVISPVSNNDSSPVVTRVNDVHEDGYSLQLEKWEYQPASHPEETVSFMVVEAGVHYLGNGTKIMAGNTTCNHNWKKVYFPEGFTKKPIVFTQCVSREGATTVVTRLTNINLSSFDVRLQEEEAQDNKHLAEAISWIAIEPGQYNTEMPFEAVRLSDRLTHKVYPITFKQTYGADPVFLANIQTHHGGDTCNLRYDELNNKGVKIYIQEEQSREEEMYHGRPEEVGYITFHSTGILQESNENMMADNTGNLKKAVSPSIKIFPNPFIDNFTITIQNAQMKTASVTIKDFMGNPVYTNQAFPTNTAQPINALTFDMSFYYVDVLVDGQLETARIMKKNN